MQQIETRVPSGEDEARDVTVNDTEGRQRQMGRVVYHVVGGRADLHEGDVKCVAVEGRAIALYRIGGEFFATDDTCTHAHGSLCEGYVEGEEVEYPLHGGRFNVCTGEATCPQATEGLATYEVRVEGEDILIGIRA